MKRPDIDRMRNAVLENGVAGLSRLDIQSLFLYIAHLEDKADFDPDARLDDQPISSHPVTLHLTYRGKLKP